jgi:hypothetical protein
MNKRSRAARAIALIHRTTAGLPAPSGPDPDITAHLSNGIVQTPQRPVRYDCPETIDYPGRQRFANASAMDSGMEISGWRELTAKNRPILVLPRCANGHNQSQ